MLDLTVKVSGYHEAFFKSKLLLKGENCSETLGHDNPKGVEEGDIIPPIRRGGNLVSPERSGREELVAAARLDGIMGYVGRAKR
jgi:hypothetical protein